MLCEVNSHFIGDFYPQIQKTKFPAYEKTVLIIFGVLLENGNCLNDQNGSRVENFRSKAPKSCNFTEKFRLQLLRLDSRNEIKLYK